MTILHRPDGYDWHATIATGDTERRVSLVLRDDRVTADGITDDEWEALRRELDTYEGRTFEALFRARLRMRASRFGP